MEGLGFLSLITLFIIGLIQLFMIIRFFEMAKNISNINKSLTWFTKYYFELHEKKNSSQNI